MCIIDSRELLVNWVRQKKNFSINLTNNMNSFYVYMLRCSDCSYYTGHTDDLEKRLVEHNAGQYGGYTAERLPVELVFVQEFATRDEAFVAEHRIKKWTRTKKEALIQSHWERLKALSKKKFKQ